MARVNQLWYGVATISRLLKIIGLFCRAFLKILKKEPYNLKEPTDRSHPICVNASFHTGQMYVRVNILNSTCVMAHVKES